MPPWPGIAGPVNGWLCPEAWPKANPVNTTMTDSSSTSMAAATQLAGVILPTDRAVTSAIMPRATQPTGRPPGTSEDRYVADATRIEAVETRPSSMNSTLVVPPQTGPSARQTIV